jgi:hypothetical protein
VSASELADGLNAIDEKQETLTILLDVVYEFIVFGLLVNPCQIVLMVIRNQLFIILKELSEGIIRKLVL